ncbi:glycosyltransferase family 4 protein [Tamlana sp. 2_MG-2023]|uniref:glycosyltransferase family 4 protein n=1 Tax=unclassified Tamlana TaxID=2614803 RepID=UPI0026E26DE6|nr:MULTISPECIES: glycosyltransferase family 4 protein [unclassified Tamlana]MDO6758774.1 glycosyltransferase family 4 protein [Tamlana sp. 2_MG-2023]MDO6789473.1 glycosyltransferase family 4 protein [Tamlana sp. 1_MG-2023]
MKTILYIGNQLATKNKTVTTVDTLSRLLGNSGFKVITASKKENKLARLLDMLGHVWKYRKSLDYVLIDTYSTQNFYYAYLCAKLCSKLNLKYIPILHGGNLPNRLKKSPNLSKTLFKNAYVNVAPSNYTKSNFEALGYHNIICIPNTIELKNYPFESRCFDKVKLLWVRSFSEIYNPMLAVDLLKALNDENIAAELCMVGPDVDGSFQKTKNHAESLGVAVTFTGKLSKPEWIALSKDYNVFINTTNVDNMPVSVIEAMALGLFVVSTNVGGMPFLIKNEENGVLVAPNSVDALVKVISRVVVHPSKVEKMTQKARQDMEQYDWEQVEKHWLKVFS